MKSRSQPDAEARVPREPLLVDPEAYDASEQQFAASLEETSDGLVAREAALDATNDNAGGVILEVDHERAADTSTFGLGPETQPPGKDAAFLPQNPAADPDSWRQEVAARLNRYRARRRPREPRYPSLRLKFEPSEPAWAASPAHIPENQPEPHPATRLALEFTPAAPASQSVGAAEPVSDPVAIPETAAEPTARIIPFPRSSVAPPRPLEELAEPVPDPPRILEVPEVAPPPPALGGILIAPVEESAQEKRPGFEIPLQSVHLAPRLLAAAVDGALALLAVALSGCIFLKLALAVPPARQLAPIAIGGLGICWFGYQYLLLVYAGTTLGLKAAGLRLTRFDGSATPRRIRRWRVLASALSGISLGLGYAWCLLDEDQLCWHDRITRTYLAPASRGSGSRPTV